jgi:subtilase family serine protease
MRRRLTGGVAARRLIVRLAAVLLGLAALPAAAAAQVAPHVLGANVLSGLAGLTSSAANPAAPMTVGLALSRPRPASEVALYRQLYQPGSSRYRHFLTPATFARRFTVPAAKYAAAIGWLRAGGLTVDTASRSHDYILATGSVDQIQRVFATTIRSFNATGTSFLANTSPPQVPGGLPILSVLGLNTYQRFTTPAHAAGAVHGLLSQLGLPNIGATTPQSLWSVYDQPNAYRGAGQSLAVFGSGASGGTLSDLTQFEHANGLPTVPVTVRNVGPGTFSDTSGAEEWDIDTQASTGMAPDVRGLTLYFGDNLVDATVENLLTTWVNDPNGPAQANASFGECERTPLDPVFLGLPGDVSQDPNATLGLTLGNNLEPVAEQTLRQAAIEGRTLFSSTGDTGSSCPVLELPVVGAGNGVLNQVLPLTSYPASSPYAVAVGGTVLYTTGATPDSRFAEYAWTFTGGGDSLLINAPDYQRGTPGLFLPCVATPDGQLTNLGQPCRGVPDVAAQSGDVLSNGYAIVADGAASQGGGTSLSSPLWAGMWARINQSAGGAGYGFANETLYRLGKNETTRARDFFDVTLGINGLYAALPGWDYVSGFGTPDVANIIADAR